MVGKNIRNCIQYFLCFHYLHFLTVFACVYCFNLMCICLSQLYLLYLMCICFMLCVFVVSYVFLLYLMCFCCILCVFVVPYVYLLYYVFIDILTFDAALLARGQFPSFQVAITCLSCSPPDLNFLVTSFFIFVYM